MLTCPNCHAELEEDALFCDSCGAKVEKINSLIEYCPHCGKQVNIEFQFCQYCGKPISENPEAHPKKSGLKKGLLFGGIGTAVIIAASFLVFFLFTSIGNGHRETTKEHPETDYALYLKDNEIFFSDLSKEPWQLTSRLIDDIDELDDFLQDNYQYYLLGLMQNYSHYQTGGLFQVSKDGKTIFFADKLNDHSNSFSLYYKNISKPEEDAIKIASDIVSYQVDQNASIVTYFKGNNGNLYQYDIKKETEQKIGSDVSLYHTSDDGQKIFYMTEDNNIYWAYRKNDKEKIASDISYIAYVAEDLSTVYYIKDATLYKKEEGKETVKISSDISDVLSIYETGEAYYIKRNEENVPLLDYVENDIILADASESIPAHSTAPVPPTVSNAKTPTVKASVTSYSWWDSPYYNPSEETPAIVIDPAAPAEESPEEVAGSAFYEGYDLPSQQKLLEDLNSNTITIHSYTLYYYDGEKESIISDYVTTYPENYASDFPEIAFRAYDPSDIEKFKLSNWITFPDITSFYNYVYSSGYNFKELDQLFNISSHVQSSLQDSAKDYIAINDNITEIDRDTEYITPFFFSKDGKAIYYMDNVTEDKMEGDLYKIAVSGKELKKAELYDYDVYASSMQFITDDKFLYFKDYHDCAGDLYINKNLIDSDVVGDMLSYNKAEDSLIYLTDLNTDKSSFSLNIFQNDSSEKIADDVHSFALPSRKGILYVSDYSKKYLHGDLYLYKNKKDKANLIDDTVTDIISFYNAGYLFSRYGEDIVYIY